MKVIAEVGSNWQRVNFPLLDAIKAALDCGADLVKVQFWSNGKKLAMRRGGSAGLDEWGLSAVELLRMAVDLSIEYGRLVLGASVFSPEDAGDLASKISWLKSSPLAFVKTATQEYQWAALAEVVSELSVCSDTPLYVSVPRDGCLTVGNYHSGQPITWLYCEPKYPAELYSYKIGRMCDRATECNRLAEMAERLPGLIGLSDHTIDAKLVEELWGGLKYAKGLACVEKHFCYHEGLRGKTPDAGPWSLSQKDFREYVKVAHGGVG
jgi:hypothetical protein